MFLIKYTSDGEVGSTAMFANNIGFNLKDVMSSLQAVMLVLVLTLWLKSKLLIFLERLSKTIKSSSLMSPLWDHPSSRYIQAQRQSCRLRMVK